MRAGRIALLALLLVVIGVAASLAQRARFGREPLAPGDRVAIVASDPVAPGARGTVTLPPLPVTGDEAGWAGHVRHAPDGTSRFWVTLDRPLDRAGAPPLRGVERPATALERR